MRTTRGNCSDRVDVRLAVATATMAAAVSVAMLVTGLSQSLSGGAAALASTSAPASPGQPAVKAARTKLGEILVDAKGMVLYRYTADRKDVSNCSASCLPLWPILSPGSDGRPAAGSGAAQRALGVMTRKDGKQQVTYDDWPLYTYIVDKAPGQTAGQGVKDAGGIWYVVYADPGKNPTPPTR